MKRYDPTPPWKTYDVLFRDEHGQLTDESKRPFLDQLVSGGTLPTAAIGMMWLLGAHGWPKARLEMREHRGKSLVDRADSLEPAIWILKCKPSCWRLYFYAYEGEYEGGEKRIVYLYAKCKKKNKRAAGDSQRARTVFRGIGGPSGSGIAEFPFPTGEAV